MLPILKMCFLSGNILNIFFLKENKITRVFEPFIFKYSNKTNRQTIIAGQSLWLWPRRILSCIPTATSPLVGLFKWQLHIVQCCDSGCWGNSRNSEASAGGWRCLEVDQSLCWGWEVSALGMRPLCCELGVGGLSKWRCWELSGCTLEILGGQGGLPCGPASKCLKYFPLLH